MSKTTKTKAGRARRSNSARTTSSGGYFGSPVVLVFAAAAVLVSLLFLRLTSKSQDLEREIQAKASLRGSLRDAYVRENASWNKMKSRDNVLAKLADWNIVMGEPCFDQIVQLPMTGGPLTRRAPEAVIVGYASR